MNKLIKVSDEHYIVVDDIKPKTCVFYSYIYNQIYKYELYGKYFKNEKGGVIDEDQYSMITHSTKIIHKNIENISLAEVEEAVLGYNVDNLYAEYCRNNSNENVVYKDFLSGFKIHQNLVKDKVFTIKDMEYCYNMAARRAKMQEAGFDTSLGFKDYIQRYHPKRKEWRCTFENDKLKLL